MEIQSITESFALQPETHYIDRFYTTAEKGKFIQLKKIELEGIYINGDPYDYYVGYDENKNKIFEIRRELVSVFYKIR